MNVIVHDDARIQLVVSPIATKEHILDRRSFFGPQLALMRVKAEGYKVAGTLDSPMRKPAAEERD